MKKIITVLLCLFILCACSGGNEKPAEESKSELDLIKEKGKIIVAMEGTWQPFTYHNEQGELVGFDVEVAKYIADYIGVEVEYVEGEWDGLLMGVASGRYDMLVNGVGATDERKETYDFSDAYAYDRSVVMVKADNEDIKSLDDLNGKVTANTISSTYAAIAEEHGATVQGVDDLTQTIELLKQGRVDATLNAEVVYGDYVKTTGDNEVKIACYTGITQDIAIPMKKGSSELVKVVNEAIAKARTDGTLKALSEKYFGTDITTKQD
ncbi:MAG: transporter substrate-binding domain-containing protein [Erysipelotrichaceae bacterium]|nr:transporter substrate-binding domain-containing protein [Erysipelotrichaceae bacterium]